MKNNSIENNAKNMNEELLELINNFDIGNNGVIQLFFGKKRRENNETKYNFYRAPIADDVRDLLIKILKKNFKRISRDNLVDEINDENGDYFVKRELDDINNWKNFEYVIFNELDKFQDKTEGEIDKFNKNKKKKVRKTNKLEKMKSNLNSYLFVYENDELIIGQINRIFPKNVIVDPSVIRLVFQEELFTKINSDENVEIGEHSDILFFINKDYNICFTKNNNFIEIFDMNEQYESEACDVINRSSFVNYCDDEDIEKTIIESRIIQKMLNNPMTIKGFENFEWESFNNSITEINKEFSFRIENNNVILDTNNKSDAFKDVIKVIGYRFTKTLNDNEIIEGVPKTFINK